MEQKRFTKATWQIMEQLLEVDSLEEALAGSLEIIVNTLEGEAGAIWLLDRKTERLSPVFHMGPADISGISVENGLGVEGLVTKTGKSVMIADASSDPRIDGTVFDDGGLPVKTMICVPLNNLRDVIGCVQVINKKDGSAFDEDELQLCERMAALAAITIEEKGFSVDLEEEKEILLSLRNVTREYPSGEGVTRVLRGINLDIYKNEFVVILTIEGKDFSHPSDDDLTRYRRDYVGFIFQAYNLMPNLTALENVEFIAELVKDPMPASEAIAAVGLTERADNYPSQMSGGQQQRVSIARAIVKRPRLIMADEPTAALDYATSIEVLSVIENIVRTQGTTVMMVTHNPEIAKMADRVVKVRSGKVASIRKNMHPLRAEELVW